MCDKEELILLWDGKRYPRSEIEARWPGVGDYAGSHERLVETIEFSAATFTRQFVKICGVAFACFFTVLLVPYVIEAGLVRALSVAVLCLPFFGLLFMLMYLGARSSTEARFPVTLVVKDGVVHVTGHYVTKPLVHKIDELQWHVGLTSAGGRRYEWLPERKVILLVMSPRNSRWAWLLTESVPCGLTDDSFRRWHALLSLSGAREVQSGRGRTLSLKKAE